MAVVCDDQIEGAIGFGIEIRERPGGSGGIGVVERLEHELAPRTPVGGRPERAVAVEHRGDDAPVVDPEPRPAGKDVAPGDQLRAVRPMPAGRLGGTVDHLVAIGADQHRPAMARTAKDHQGAHSASGAAAAQPWQPQTPAPIYDTPQLGMMGQ